MTRSAFVLGGSGFIGRAITRTFEAAGWEVTVASRGRMKIPDGSKQETVDRHDLQALRGSLGSGTDVLVDVIPYDQRDGEQLLQLKDLVGSIVAISSASVYMDDEGRTLDDTSRAELFPHYPELIPESQPTVPPGPETYSTRKAALEQVLLGQDELDVTVVRPCAVFGVNATHCREWYFVKRILDRRPHVLLAYRGESSFHTTALENLAELVRLAAEKPGTRAFNSADPDPPNVLRMEQSIVEEMGYEWDVVAIPDELSEEPFLENPWAAPRPLIVDMTKATEELGYVPVTTYADAIGPAIRWIADEVKARGPEAFAEAIPYLPHAFDYAAEDEFLVKIRVK